jgi:hypothetical protein
MSYIGNEPIVSATRTVTEVTATAGQTVFTANGGYTVGYLDVFLNGVQLQTVDFTATDGSSVTLGSAASSGDEVRLVAWGTFSAADVYTKAQSDANYQPLDSDLTTLASNGFGSSANKIPQFDSSGWLPLGSGWKVKESAGVLYFAVGSTNYMKLDASGNLTVSGNVTAYGTV